MMNTIVMNLLMNLHLKVKVAAKKKIVMPAVMSLKTWNTLLTHPLGALHRLPRVVRPVTVENLRGETHRIALQSKIREQLKSFSAISVNKMQLHSRQKEHVLASCNQLIPTPRDLYSRLKTVTSNHVSVSPVSLERQWSPRFIPILHQSLQLRHFKQENELSVKTEPTQIFSTSSFIRNARWLNLTDQRRGVGKRNGLRLVIPHFATRTVCSMYVVVLKMRSLTGSFTQKSLTDTGGETPKFASVGTLFNAAFAHVLKLQKLLNVPAQYALIFVRD